MNAVASQTVEIGLVDAISTQGYEQEIEEKSLSIYKILDMNTGFGVILSGEFTRVETDMRSFVTANQAKISKFVEEKVGILTVSCLVFCTVEISLESCLIVFLS